MSGVLQPSSFFIGWDVGAWHCKTRGESCDAIVILDSNLVSVGPPWRGNLREYINEATTSTDLICKLFALCDAKPPAGAFHITLAIDTPLGFSEAFLGLVTGLVCVERLDDFRSNPYLFRRTERYLYEQGLKPLSAVQDQIGSQATKGMHVLGKFAPKRQSCGVWTDGGSLTAIEAYPSACKTSATIKGLQQPFGKFDYDDIDDALTCALLAYLFAVRAEDLEAPTDSVPDSEGWIWVPKDGLQQQQV